MDVETWGKLQGNLGTARVSIQNIDYSSRGDSICLVCIAVGAFMFEQHWALEVYDTSTVVLHAYLLVCLQSSLLLVMTESMSRDLAVHLTSHEAY